MCDSCGMGSGDCFGGNIFGGAGSPTYNNPFNTVGVGDLVPAGTHELGNDFRQMGIGRPKKGRKHQITNIATKRPAPQPFVTRGRNTGYDMSPRPLIVPHNPRRK